jgi:hypothetical protein
MKTYKHKQTGIIGKTNDQDYFLHIERGNSEYVALETISMVFVENSNDWEEVTPTVVPTEKLPTKWFKTEEIETWIGKSITTEGESIDESGGGRGKLIVLHQCGENKEELISQLETMIHGLKDGFNMFAG